MYQPNYERIAQKIVRENLHVQPGDQVLLDVRSDAVPYAEQIAFEIFKVGGVVTVLLRSDELRYQEIMESHLEHLATPRRPQVAAVEAADYQVSIGMFTAEPDRFRNLPGERVQAFELREQARRAVIFGPEAKTKWLGTGYPTRYMAQAYNIPWNRFFEMYWRAMDVDYGKMRARAAALDEVLQRTDHVHITTPRGTDLRFRRGDRPVFKDDGTLDKVANLPAGEVYFAPLEDTVEGRVVFDRAFHEGEPISYLEIDFEGGIGTPRRALEGYEVFLRRWEPATQDKNRLGEMGIGINSELHAPTGFLLTDEKIMGTVHLALGHNRFMGGENDSTLHWDMVLLQPTVTLDDEMILDNGRFLLD